MRGAGEGGDRQHGIGGGEYPRHIARERYEVGTEPRHAPSLEINSYYREQERFGFGDREMLWY